MFIASSHSLFVICTSASLSSLTHWKYMYVNYLLKSFGIVLSIVGYMKLKRHTSEGNVQRLPKSVSLYQTFGLVKTPFSPDWTEFHRTEKISSFSCSGCFQPRATKPAYFLHLSFMKMSISCTFSGITLAFDDEFQGQCPGRGIRGANPPRDHPCQVWFNLVQRFQRRRFKCDLLSK
jgi:hypothetical protein